MKTKQADKLIKAGKPVTVRNTHFDETFTTTFISRDRYTITAADGGLFERDELEVVVPHTPYYAWEHRGVYSFNYEGKEYTDSTLGGLYALASKVGVEIHPNCG